MKQPHELFQNRILRVISLILICILTMQAVFNGTLTSLALEQSSYCGMEEHTHTEECYLETILVCNKKAHTHGENCYLLLLKDNNINLLLEEMDQTEDKSLTSVMEHAVDQAIEGGLTSTDESQDTTNDHSLILNAVEETTGGAIEDTVTSESAIEDVNTSEPAIEDVTTTEPAIDDAIASEPAIDDSDTEDTSTSEPAIDDANTSEPAIDDTNTSEPAIEETTTTDSAIDEDEDLLTKLEGTQIGDLNNALQTNTSLPSIVLNENMVGLESNEALMAANIVDEEVTNGKANFYVYFVDEEGQGAWTFIGTEDYSKQREWPWGGTYYWSVNRDSVFNLIEGAMPGIDSGNLDLSYYYAKSTDASSWTKTSTMTPFMSETTYITMGQASGNSTSNGTYHVYIGARGTSPSAEPNTKFCRVTYHYSAQNSEVIYYKVGEEITLPELAEGYVWKDQNDITYQGSETVELAKSYEFEMDLLGYNVTFETNGGTAVDAQNVKEGNYPIRPSDPTRTGYTFGGWYSDEACTIPFDFSAVVTSNTTVYAKWIPEERTITYLRVDGSIIATETHLYDEVVTLSELPEGAIVWKENTTLTYFNAGDTLTIQKNYVLQAVEPYTVTRIDAAGEVISTESVIPGDTYTLEAPESGYVWTDDSGHAYNTQTELTINRNLILRLNQYITINYTVNYDEDAAEDIGVPKDGHTPPTVNGGDTSSYIMIAGTTVTIYEVSSEEVTVDFPLASGNNSRPGVAAFEGWQVEGADVVLFPGEAHTYAEMSGYAVDGVVELVGTWMYNRHTAVNFFIEYDSSGTSGSEAIYWTPVLYITNYEGVTAGTGSDVSKSNVSDQDGDGDVDNYDADIVIRGMIDRTKSKYLHSFPTDEIIFKYLENYTNKLTVDGLAVTAQELNEHGFTILWTKLAYVSADSNFHVDGMLVRKNGYINVTKTFSGNEEAIQSVKDSDYYISAVSQEDGETQTLTLENYESYDAVTDTYTWRIKNVAYGEEWILTEHNYTANVNGVTIEPYMAYTISDALGNQSGHDEYSGSVSVTGQTYDSTISTDEVLTVGFNNIYQGTDTFILKKEDSDTGNALAGASFSLYQNGNILAFDYSNGVYTCAVDGAVTELDCTSGFLEITIQGLDFSQGDISLQETQTPEGYISLANDIHLTKNESGSIEIVGGDSTASRMSNGVLIVGNTSTTATVTVTKNWSNLSDARDVVINLLANGELLTTLFPDLSGVTAVVTLNEAGDFEYTWENLPAYADGSLIQWSVEETRIGTERANSDGSFDNWTVLYSGAKTSVDDEGNTTVTMTITNARKSGNTFVIHKVSEGGKSLSGAQFLLQMLNADGTVSTDFTAQSGTTDASGLLTFSGLPYGTYQLTETTAPQGYVAGGPILFTVNSNQTITILDDGGGAATAVTGSLAIRIVNFNGRLLPATGGSGPYGYYMLGLMFLLMAAYVTVLPKRKQKGGR